MRLKIGGMKMTEELKHKEPSDLPSIIAEANWLQELNAQAGLAFFLAAHWDRLRDAITQSPAAPAQGEPTAWLETFYEEEGGKETKVWLVEPKPDESTLSIQPLYVGRPAEGEPASASDLVKIAAELHRAKWQFDLQDETRLTMSEARQLVIRAFEQMHRIGDMALKMRDAAKSQSPAESKTDAEHFGDILRNEAARLRMKADELDPPRPSQPERVELPADGSPPAWCCKGAAPAAACRCAIEEGELVRLRAQVERLTAAVSGLFAGGFIEAGVRESDQWSQELAVRIGHLKSAITSTEKK